MNSFHIFSSIFLALIHYLCMPIAVIEPYFSYYCSIWGSCGASKLEMFQKLQNKAARIVTNSPFDASPAPLLQRLGWPSVQKLINKETGSMV